MVGLGTSRLMSKLCNDGHTSGTAAGLTEDGQSKVMKRHLGTDSSRILLSKERILLDTFKKTSERTASSPDEAKRNRGEKEE